MIPHCFNSATRRFDEFSTNEILDDEIVVVGARNSEDRSYMPAWENISENFPERLLSIVEESYERVSYTKGNDNGEIHLRSEKSIVDAFSSERVLIDISALSHSTWAPFIRCAYNNGINIRVVYSEPSDYKSAPQPMADSLFDLSERFEGLIPLPGFANLKEVDEAQSTVYVPLLGFEGSRPGRLMIDLDPLPDIVPIVGVPGFKIEYPKYSVVGNRMFLTNYSAGADIRYARASCPFEVYQLLSSISEDFPGAFMYIAPVGTKPHALGAICYAILNSDSVEILYDHPVRKPGRSKGVGVVHLYDFGNFDVFRS